MVMLQVVTVSGRVVEAAVTVGRADGAPHTRAVAPVMAPPARPDPNAGLLLGLPKQPWEPSYPGVGHRVMVVVPYWHCLWVRYLTVHHGHPRRGGYSG